MATIASAEASEMLEAALEQMDGFLTEATSSNNCSQSTATTGDYTISKPQMTIKERMLISSNVLAIAKTLAMALQQVGATAAAPDPLTANVINDWLEIHIPRQNLDERFRRLHRDKEALAFQYQILSYRAAEQTDRIIELEGLLAEKTHQLSSKDELLQRQVFSRSLLQTQKLELITALTQLDLHRATLQSENCELGKGMMVEYWRGGGKQFENRNIIPVLKRDQFAYGSMGNLNNAQQFESPKSSPSILRHQIQQQFHSLPRAGKNSKNGITNEEFNNNSHVFDANANTITTKQRNVAFASNEKILIDDYVGSVGVRNNNVCDRFISQGSSSPSPNLRERSEKGLRNIFGKLRRSKSGCLELPSTEQTEPKFKRGGVARATAGGRIEWTPQPQQSMSYSKCYTDWSPQDVCNWLCDLGLGCYEENCRKWLKTNPSISFFNASPLDIEKELSLKAHLHIKKIVLACDELTGREEDALALKAAQLDISWVMRWLEDIGLPQYKDTFMQAKVDGRMLHRLTMEDLANLHLSSCLHIASLRRGIQIMREMYWNPECLIRRSMSTTTPHRSNDTDVETERKDGKDHITSESIGLWTAHRVMEWLRVVDLSEYAPNLRGAGVHGALMYYEPRFNADLLADLLSIPPSKTLLRRHLASHFKELLGRDAIQAKRDAEAVVSYQPLTIASKIKPLKKMQFSLKKRKSLKGVDEAKWTDYVCPMTAAANTYASHNTNNKVSASGSSTSTSTKDSMSVN